MTTNVRNIGLENRSARRIESNPVREKALLYACLGWTVFPIHATEPADTWLHAATNDIEQVEEWFVPAGANIGLATGSDSEILAISVAGQMTKGFRQMLDRPTPCAFCGPEHLYLFVMPDDCALPKGLSVITRDHRGRKGRLTIHGENGWVNLSLVTKWRSSPELILPPVPERVLEMMQTAMTGKVNPWSILKVAEV